MVLTRLFTPAVVGMGNQTNEISNKSKGLNDSICTTVPVAAILILLMESQHNFGFEKAR